MIQFSKPILFLLFSASLFFLGVQLSDIILNGFSEGKDLFLQVCLVITFSCSAYIFYDNLYRAEKKK
jgi:hypothetical protein